MRLWNGGNSHHLGTHGLLVHYFHSSTWKYLLAIVKTWKFDMSELHCILGILARLQWEVKQRALMHCGSLD